MLHSSSKRIASFFVSNNIIQEEDAPVYAYGIEILLATILNMVIVFAIGIVINRIVETIFFLVTFAVVRSYSGGYHASTHLKCMGVLIVVYTLNMILLWLLPKEIWLYAMLLAELASIGIIFRLAPIESHNKPLDEKERKRYKKKSRFWVLLFSIFSLAGYFMFEQTRGYFFTAILGLLSAAVSVVAAFRTQSTNRRKEETP